MAFAGAAEPGAAGRDGRGGQVVGGTGGWDG